MSRFWEFERLLAPLSGVLPLPWCWVIPGLLGLVGAVGAGAALAPTLQIVTIPAGIVGGAFHSRSLHVSNAHCPRPRIDSRVLIERE